MALISLVLGPFALWFLYLGKLRRRGLVAPGWWLVLALFFSFIQGVLWLAPIRWEWIVLFYLLLSGGSLGVFLRFEGFRRFLWNDAASDPKDQSKKLGAWGEHLILGGLVLYPTFFGFGLFRDIQRLKEFSIYLPASVYTDALLFAFIYGTPAMMALAWLTRQTFSRPSIRVILNLLGGSLVAFCWIILWQYFYHIALQYFGSGNDQPLVFRDIYKEIFFRNSVQAVFQFIGILLSTAYLATSPKTLVFFRRAVFLCLPLLLGYSNLLLLRGEGGYFIAGLRDYLYRENRVLAYQRISEIEISRWPRAFYLPYLMRDLSDVLYLEGDKATAEYWRTRILVETKGKPYYGPLHQQVEWSSKKLASSPHCSFSPNQVLQVPQVRPGTSLDANWYALLGAITFLHPEWNDFDLKKRLLEVSSEVQLSVPVLGSVPMVTEVLDIFGVPFTTGFFSEIRIQAALKQGSIPFLNFSGRWISLVGWDSCRQGYWYHHYPDSLDRNPWLNSPDLESLLGESSSGKKDSNHSPAKVPIPFNLLNFIPSRDLMRHLHDIGGIAMVIGDSSFASTEERKASFLVEYGDGLYQEQDDFVGAAEAYVRAQALFPSDYILARELFLERRAKCLEGSSHHLGELFRAKYYAQPQIVVSPSDRQRITDKIIQGELGQYLLLQWHENAPRFYFRPDLPDSTSLVFHTWFRLEPYNPGALDSLATFFAKKSQWDSSEFYFRQSLAFYPMGNEYLNYRLAWNQFQQEKFGDLKNLLKHCEGFKGEARYLLMQGVLAWQQGHRKTGIKSLGQSLKLDKSLPETYAWKSRMASKTMDSAGVALSQKWLERAKR